MIGYEVLINVKVNRKEIIKIKKCTHLLRRSNIHSVVSIYHWRYDFVTMNTGILADQGGFACG
jgi:hypothetical protein